MGSHQRCWHINVLLMIGWILGLSVWAAATTLRADPPAVAATDSTAPTPAGKKATDEPKKTSPAKEIRRLMSQPTDKLKTGIDKGTPLKDALDFICRIHEVRPGQPLKYVIDHHSFANVGEINIEEKQVELPPMPNVPLATIFAALFSRFDPPELRATYLVKGDYIEITTCLSLERPFAQAVRVEFDKRSLEDALEELTDLSGHTIVLDGSLGDKAKARVSGVYQDVPLRTVVCLLADMAGLQTATLDNALYVTTPEKAERLRKEGKRLLREEEKRDAESWAAQRAEAEAVERAKAKK